MYGDIRTISILQFLDHVNDGIVPTSGNNLVHWQRRASYSSFKKSGIFHYVVIDDNPACFVSPDHFPVSPVFGKYFSS